MLTNRERRGARPPATVTGGDRAPHTIPRLVNGATTARSRCTATCSCFYREVSPVTGAEDDGVGAMSL